MSDLIYWIAMVLIIGASAALLTGTFLSMKKNKKEKSRNTGRISARGRAYDPDEEEYSGRRHTAQEGRRRTEQQERANEKKQWKIILENLDTWEKHSFIFYDTVAIGRGSDVRTYEKYLSVSEDPRVSKLHCAIVRKGDKLYLKDLESRNGTYLNGKRIERPVMLQRDDVIGAGESRCEVLKVLRERDS